MPDTRMTVEKFKQHVYYNKWIYAAVIAGALMLSSLLFTTTAYRAPNARRIDIELMGGYMNAASEEAEVAVDQLLAAGKAWETARDAGLGIDVTAPDYEADLQELTVLGLDYTGDANTENGYYGAQKYMVMMAAQEGDIYCVSRVLLTDLVESNMLYPLDSYLADGILSAGSRNLDRVTFDECDDDGNPTGEQHVFALQADYLTGLATTFEYDPTDRYLCIVRFSQNPDTAAAVLGEMQAMFETEETEAPTDSQTTTNGAFAQPDDTPDGETEAAS